MATYRDDLGALRVRLNNLEAERKALQDTKRELEETSRRLDEVDAELTDVRRRFEKERRLPLLQNVRVAAPCSESWDDMVGDERVRFCGRCAKNVYNVIALTREEAENVIRDHEGEVCMRLYQRKDGTILTADCPVGTKRRRRRRMVAGALMSAAAGVGGAWLYQDATVAAGEIEVLPYDAQAQTGEIDARLEAPAVMGTVAPVAPPAPKPASDEVPVGDDGHRGDDDHGAEHGEHGR